MAIANVFVDGEPWEIMGNVTDEFLNFTNDVEASRSGRIFVKTESKARKLSIDSVKATPQEYKELFAFLSTCGTSRFTLTIVLDAECEDTLTRIDYTNAVIMGDPSMSLFEQTVSGFEVAYEACVISNG